MESNMLSPPCTPRNSPPCTPQKSNNVLITNAPPDAPKKKYKINQNIKREIDRIIQMDIDKSNKITLLKNLGINDDVIINEIIPFEFNEESSIKLKLNF